MRFPPNLKYFLLFIVAIGLIALATIYLPMIIPNIGDIIIGLVSFGMIALVFFVFVKPFVMFLYARADGLFEVYMDKSEKGIHVFSYHLNSGGESSTTSTRDIQHHFILLGNGKSYYKELFSHDMEPASGRSGWGDFYSFDESVLQSDQLPKSLQKFSDKTNMDLALGRHLRSHGDPEEYEIFQNEYVITIKKFSNPVDEGYKIVCKNKPSDRIVWTRKI